MDYRPDSDQAFGQAIKHLLERKGMSQREFAKRSDLAPDYVSKLVNGKIKEPRREFQQKIAMGLGFSSVDVLWAEIQRLNATLLSESLSISVQEQQTQEYVRQLVQQLRIRQADRLLELYRHIRLLNTRQVEIDSLYVDVYVLEVSRFRFITSADLIRGIDQDQATQEKFDRLGLSDRENQDRHPGLDIAKQKRRLMVVGKPGSGKTTFVRSLVVACCRGEFAPERIPVLLELRTFQNRGRVDLTEWLLKDLELKQTQDIDTLMRHGALLFLLDGLDEVSIRVQQEVIKQLEKLTDRYYRSQFILTCRTQTLPHGMQSFDHVEVANFTLEQVEQFIRNWFGALHRQEDGAMLIQTLNTKTNHPVRELATSPVLLSLICLGFEFDRKLPVRRAELYQRGLDLLLQIWDKDREIVRMIGSDLYQRLSLRDKQRLLSHIAAHKFRQPKNFILFEQQELEDMLSKFFKLEDSFWERLVLGPPEESEGILRAIEDQHGLLIERARGVWSFSHLTFQEFFLAKWFCEPIHWKELLQHIDELRWREVFLLTFGALEDASRLAWEMKAVIDQLIAEDDKLQEFLNWVYDKSNEVKGDFKPAAVRAYYYSYDRLFDRTLEEALDSSIRLTLDLYSTQDRDQDLGLIRALDLAAVLKLTCDIDIDIDVDSYIDHALNSRHPGNTASRVAGALYLKGRLYTSDISTIFSEALKLIKERRSVRILGHEHRPILGNALDDLAFHKKLQDLADQILENQGQIKDWWRSHGTKWEENLCQAMFAHRNINHGLTFAPGQRELLKKYYNANKLLVECLISDCSIAHGIKAAIESQLLLPISKQGHRGFNLTEFN